MAEGQVFQAFQERWRDINTDSTGPSDKLISGGVGSSRWLFCPGFNPVDERVLLVAHADTCREHQHAISSRQLWKSEKDGKIRRYNGVLGADDRAGCFAMWHLMELGHSVLITAGEEVGCVGASAAAAAIGEDVLSQHQFAIEIDRRGGDDAVVYHETTCDEFEAYIREAIPGWLTGYGSMTDIATICPDAQICGVNLSAGFENEHTKRESVDPDALFHTIRTVWKWLTSGDPLPKFAPDQYLPSVYMTGGIEWTSPKEVASYKAEFWPPFAAPAAYESVSILGDHDVEVDKELMKDLFLSADEFVENGGGWDVNLGGWYIHEDNYQAWLQARLDELETEKRWHGYDYSN
jgi:hypothetical protein